MATKQSVTITHEYSPTLPPWAKLSYWQKVREIIQHAQKQNGHAVTVNMSPEFENYILKCRDPKRAIGKRINEELSKLNLQSLPILLILEVTREGRPHVHGVFIAGGTSKKAIQKALRRGVGYVTGLSGSRQFDAHSIYDASGWSDYITTDLRRTKKKLLVQDESDLVWKSRSITQAAREHYEALRLKLAAPANLSLPPVSTAI